MIIKDILQHDSSQGSINSIQRLVKFDTNLCKFATNTPENAKLKRWGVFIVSFEYLFTFKRLFIILNNPPKIFGYILSVGAVILLLSHERKNIWRCPQLV